MNKTELIVKVKEALSTEERKVKKEDATKAVDAVLDAIADALKTGDKVQLIGFGALDIRERAARKGRNPQTGEEIEIAASKTVGFKPAKQLKESLN